MSLQDAKLELEAYLGSNAPVRSRRHTHTHLSHKHGSLLFFRFAAILDVPAQLFDSTGVKDRAGPGCARVPVGPERYCGHGPRALNEAIPKTGLALHNAFLRTVLVNAATKDSASLPTSGERLIGFGEASGDYARPKEKRPQVRLTDELVRRLHKTREIMTIAKADRQNIKALVQRRKGSKNAAPPPPPPVNLPPPVLLFTPMQNPLRFRTHVCVVLSLIFFFFLWWWCGGIVPADNDSCWDTREIPGYAELRQRLLQKVDESGLKFVNDQVVYLLMFALEV